MSPQSSEPSRYPVSLSHQDIWWFRLALETSSILCSLFPVPHLIYRCLPEPPGDERQSTAGRGSCTMPLIYYSCLCCWDFCASVLSKTAWCCPSRCLSEPLAPAHLVPRMKADSSPVIRSYPQVVLQDALPFHPDFHHRHCFNHTVTTSDLQDRIKFNWHWKQASCHYHHPEPAIHSFSKLQAT